MRCVYAVYARVIFTFCFSFVVIFFAYSLYSFHCISRVEMRSKRIISCDASRN